MASPKSTDLVPVGDYSVMQHDPQELAEILRDNIGSSLDQFDLDRVGIPAGGALNWTVPTLDGEESVKTLEGVIVYWKEPRAYWETSFDESGGGSPPDCTSEDSQIGNGKFGPGSDANPSGQCATCPMSQWGSAPGDSPGQACKQMRVLFMVSPENMLPTAVVLPPTSIKPVKKYMLRLASKSVPYYGAITKLELEKDQSSTGIKFSKAKPSLGQVLEPEQAKQLKAYGDAIRHTLDASVMQVAADMAQQYEGYDDQLD